MSFRNDVLSVLWSGRASAVGDGEAVTFARLLRALSPVRAVLVATESGALEERVLLDDVEIMPSLTIGDIMAEELNLQVPYGTVIAFVPAAAMQDCAPPSIKGKSLGRLLGQIILEAVNRGSFPMEIEIGMMFRLAATAVSTAGHLETRKGQISSSTFERAVAETLYRGLAGRESSDKNLTLAAVRDLYASGAMSMTGPALISFFPMSFDNWIAAISPVTEQDDTAAGQGFESWRLRSSKI
jgi:hypothetical protein